MKSGPVAGIRSSLEGGWSHQAYVNTLTTVKALTRPCAPYRSVPCRCFARQSLPTESRRAPLQVVMQPLSLRWLQARQHLFLPRCDGRRCGRDDSLSVGGHGVTLDAPPAAGADKSCFL